MRHATTLQTRMRSRWSFARFSVWWLGLLATGCGAPVVQSPHPSLQHLWDECKPVKTHESAHQAPHIYTCMYDRALYQLPERGLPDIVDVDIDHPPTSNTAFARTEPYVVVRGLAPTDRVTVASLGPERLAIGDAARVVLGLATLGGAKAAFAALPGAPTATVEAARSASEAKSSPYAARTEHLTLAPGLTGVLLLHHKDRERMLRVSSQKGVDFLLGGAASVDFSPLASRPFGTVTIGDHLPGSTTRALQFTADPVWGVTAHVLVGIRVRDTAFWLGTPVFSTSGSALSGIGLHIGERMSAFSQAMYIGVYGAARWASRPRTDGFTGDDNIDHLPRDYKGTFTFGFELQFDALTLAGGHDALVDAFSGD
jgi:hypothetical protein